MAIERGDDTHTTGIVFPDIPDAITAGDTVEREYELAVEVAHIADRSQRSLIFCRQFSHYRIDVYCLNRTNRRFNGALVA
ncbi:hypothetical protein F0A16_16445 [Salinicola corii]|uniref:Uncharacterized protein n=1 Tax=Salinicola corii TaxID=2606937 RepID=A0A640W9V8_9GAMM|nr:hypothetical protein F0A16_16445 [Salinicola corii]